MGTNYYFTPKGFNDLDEINKITAKTLNEIKNTYITNVKNLIDSAKQNHSIYQEVLDTNEENIDDIKAELSWNYEIPEIHICKISCGWKTLFQATNMYSNLDELKSFYDKYNNDFIITDEYGSEFTLKDLVKKVKEHDSLDSSKNTHLQYENSFLHYYIDNDGIEWTTNSFE